MSRSNSNTSHVSHLTSHMITGSLLARNTVLNFVGQVVPLIVAVVTIPYIIHGMGVERFGILSLTWIVIGYFGILDLGLGRATTKFVAEALGKGETERIPAIVWTSIAFQIVLGTIGTLLLVMVTPILVEKILKVPLNLVGETKLTFYIMSVSVPIVITTANLRGVLEAAQRFDLVNAVTVPSSCLNFLLPVIGLFCGFKLPGIVILLLISRTAAIGLYLILCFRVYPQLRRSFLIDTGLLRLLFSFGGWVTVCNVLAPILGHLDRFLIGVLCTVTAVGYYSIFPDILSRFWVSPASLAMTLFPAFSTLESNKDKLKRLYVRSLKYLLLVMGPIVLVLVIFASDVLYLWLGSEWASKTTMVFQILAIGTLPNALTPMPGHLLDGIGRPDLRAKLFFSYLPSYVLLVWFLIGAFGIVGAALA